MADVPLIQQYQARKAGLYLERSSWISHWTEISQNLLPRNGRFLVSDRNLGTKRHNHIHDSTATKALRILAAGLMSGMTSPARPWFRLTTPHADLNELSSVKVWLQDVTQIMRDIFNKSNFYRGLHFLYEELGAFGTGATLVLPDFDNVIHCYPLTAGEYAITTDAKGRVNTLIREFEITVAQAVGEYGIANVSPRIKNLFDTGKGLDTWVQVTHVIEPRKDRDVTRKDAKNMAWASDTFESNATDNRFLRQSGFKAFPVLAPRWHTVGGDIYGSSPGQDALGDIKQLQHQQLRKAQGIDYQVKPPMVAPTSMKGQPSNLLPGGFSYVDSVGPAGGMKPAFEARIDLSHLLDDIRDVRNRINSAFYADLFMMISQIDKSGITAREIAEKHEEKLLMLGPVLERLHNELLSPAIDITFDRMMETGIVPPPPKELHGMEISVQFVSVLAQAQRAVGVQSVDRLIGTMGTIANLKQDPGVWDKLDTDQTIDDYAEMLGVDPHLIVADDKVQKMRGERVATQQKAAAAAQAHQMADTAAKLGNTPAASPDNMAGDLMNQFAGYSIPTGPQGA